MSQLRHLVRSGAYYDSIVLMRLQAALAKLAGVEDAGVVMATAANLEILEASSLRPPEVRTAPEDLLIVVRAETDEAGDHALGQVDALLAHRGGQLGDGSGDDDYRPKSLQQAFRLMPEARWVLVSVPGRYAAAVSRQALNAGRNVFLYSDNVSLEDEGALKAQAREKGLLVLGPDCGTAQIGGVGFGFANRVRRGRIGIVAASGTGLQAVASRIHARGAGISQAIGTGGRDLGAEVGGTTALAALDVLARDPATEVIAILSKPPAPEVGARLLAEARTCGKPVVLQLQGAPAPSWTPDGLTFTGSLQAAADQSLTLLENPNSPSKTEREAPPPGRRRWLRGLFSGGTLAYETLLGLRWFLQPLNSNIHVSGARVREGTGPSQGHTILDLGEDAFTVGRLHPMIDPDLRLRRIRQEAADPEVSLILLDVVLGDGSPPDPAGALAPTLAEIAGEGEIAVFVLLVGTNEDPQDLDVQRKALEEAGAQVFSELPATLGALTEALAGPAETEPPSPVQLTDLEGPPAAVNVGLEAFHESLLAQGARSIHVEWKPPAGGNERLAALLDKLR